jgi:NDP-sugar pyrophosphorylase family protein
VDAFCPPRDFERFVRRAEELPANATVLAVTRYVHDEKPLWVTTTRKGRVSVVGGASGNAVTAGIYVFPEEVRRLGIPSGLGRLRDFLGWLASSGQPIEAVEIQKVVDVDRAEDVAAAEELAVLSLSRRGPSTDPTTKGKPSAEGNAARTRRKRKPPAVGESSTRGKPTAVDNAGRRPAVTHTGRRPVVSGRAKGTAR